jgi:hypothetical protein
VPLFRAQSSAGGVRWAGGMPRCVRTLLVCLKSLPNVEMALLCVWLRVFAPCAACVPVCAARAVRALGARDFRFFCARRPLRHPVGRPERARAGGRTHFAPLAILIALNL